MSDPISDLLTRIRNAGRQFHPSVSIPSSKIKAEIVQVLQKEGYISDFQVESSEGNKKNLSRGDPAFVLHWCGKYTT